MDVFLICLGLVSFLVMLVAFFDSSLELPWCIPFLFLQASFAGVVYMSLYRPALYEDHEKIVHIIDGVACVSIEDKVLNLNEMTCRNFKEGDKVKVSCRILDITRCTENAIKVEVIK